MSNFTTNRELFYRLLIDDGRVTWVMVEISSGVTDEKDGINYCFTQLNVNFAN